MKASANSRARAQRIAEVTITALFWAAWLYLVMPLLSLLLWFAGIHLFVEEMIVRGGYEALRGELLHYGFVILGILLVISLWVIWNHQRYGRHNLRIHQPLTVGLNEQAQHVGLSTQALRTLQSRRYLLVTFDDKDRLVIRDGAKKWERK